MTVMTTLDAAELSRHVPLSLPTATGPAAPDLPPARGASLAAEAAGLDCAPQSFAERFTDPRAPGLTTAADTVRLRALTALAVVGLTALLIALTRAALPAGLPPGLGAVILVLTVAGFLPVALGLALALVGLARPAAPTPSPLVLPRPPAMKVALLLPIHEEDAAHVFGNAAAMLDDLSMQSLRRTGGRHEFALFVLSDTRTEANALLEQRAAAVLRYEAPPGIRVHYRRRATPVDRKLGNIRDWVETHGADWPAMIVLDADSLMSGRALVQLTDALASDPTAGLIQSVPRIIGAQTLFARLQAYAHATHGGPVAAGFAAICGDAGNYFGHNAILRTRAFAEAATLPSLPGLVRRSQRALILSHDFVEAALLRRAGWGVTVLPGITDSFEETPPTLVDHALRDRRWCRGNLQHLRLIGAAGLHPLSRLHMGLGALAYLAAPAWLALVAAWALAGAMGRVDTAGSAGTAGMASAALVLAALILPRVLAFAGPRATRPRIGPVLGALVLSTLYAPVQMVQVSLAVGRAALGLRQGWAPQNRAADRVPLGQLIAFHRIETLLGATLLALVWGGAVSPWLAVVGLPLLAAVPLSMIGNRPTATLAVAEDVRPPAIVQSAEAQRAILRQFLATDGPWLRPLPLAAE